MRSCPCIRHVSSCTARFGECRKSGELWLFAVRCAALRRPHWSSGSRKPRRGSVVGACHSAIRMGRILYPEHLDGCYKKRTIKLGRPFFLAYIAGPSPWQLTGSVLCATSESDKGLHLQRSHKAAWRIIPATRMPRGSTAYVLVQPNQRPFKRGREHVFLLYSLETIQFQHYLLFLRSARLCFPSLACASLNPCDRPARPLAYPAHVGAGSLVASANCFGRPEAGHGAFSAREPQLIESCPFCGIVVVLSFLHKSDNRRDA